MRGVTVSVMLRAIIVDVLSEEELLAQKSGTNVCPIRISA